MQWPSAPCLPPVPLEVIGSGWVNIISGHMNAPLQKHTNIKSFSLENMFSLAGSQTDGCCGQICPPSGSVFKAKHHQSLPQNTRLGSRLTLCQERKYFHPLRAAKNKPSVSTVYNQVCHCLKLSQGSPNSNIALSCLLYTQYK